MKIAERWKLDERQQLTILGLDQVTFQRCSKMAQAREDVTLCRETLERIGLVLSIFKAINILLPDPARADAWMRAPNKAPIFSGSSAIQRLASGKFQDLFIVRQYLASEINS